MSEFNFDKLKNYDAPNEWAERVIKTANSKKKERTFFTRGYRVAMLCICLILMCVMGFTVCLQALDEGFILPVNVEETVVSTKIPHMDNVNVNVSDNDDDDFDNDSETEPEEETQELEPTEKETQKVEPTKKKPEKETQKVDKVKPTKKPQSSKPSETQKPHKPESTKPYIEPTEMPIENKVVCSATIDKSKMSGSSVYCRIYDCEDDIYLGSDDMFSSQNLADVYGSSDNELFVRIYPVKRGLITENGEYIVMFYDESGKNLKTFGFTVKDFE